MSEETSLRKQDILHLAALLFREKGYLASSQRELAKQAGIKVPSLYHHFASKQDILFQIMKTTMNDMVARLEVILADTDDAEEQLRKALIFHIDFTIYGSDETYITDDELRNLTPENYQIIISRRDAYQYLYEKILVEGCLQKGWQVPDCRLMARMVVLMGSSVYRWYKQGGPLSTEEIADHYVDMICRGLVPRSI
jgi:AcrR family transcriptional regulator